MVSETTGQEDGQATGASQEKLRRVEWKIALLILRTEKFLRIYDWLGSFRATKYLGWLMLLVMLVTLALGVIFIVNSIVVLTSSPEAREVGREIGPQAYILIPGINPFIPLIYGWIGLVVALVVHEGAHGILARSLKFRVKSSGLLFLTFFPIGAFVELDQAQLESARARDSIRVFAAGPASNTLVAVVSLAALLLLVGGLSPAVDGPWVIGVLPDSPAAKAGIRPFDIITNINGEPTPNLDQLLEIIKRQRPGEDVTLRIVRILSGEELDVAVRLVQTPEGPKMGAFLYGENLLRLIMLNYLNSPHLYFVVPSLPAPSAQFSIPFSDALNRFYRHPIGDMWIPLSSLLFWIWFVNINIAIFNSLPLFPLDGGQLLRTMLKAALKGRVSVEIINRISILLTFIVMSLVISMVLLPYVLR